MFFFDFLILLVFFCCMGCERTTEKIIRDLNCKSAIETENGKTMDEELSEEELLHFNKMFFTQSQEENPYVRCLTSLYHDPKDMNIFLAFYGGSDSAKVTNENERERVMGAYNQEGTLLKISKTKMNEFLMRYIGLPVDETNKNGIELFEYDSGNYYYQTDFYPESRLSTTFLRGEHTDNKVRLYYYASDLNLADVQECSVACVTLEKNEQGYQIISNVLIPIPMYLDGPPNKVIPLQMETFLELPLLSKAPLAEDCVCWYAKKDVGPYTVCVYRILDGRLCVGFLQDETTWSTSAFRFLPDSACGIGFGVDACSNLLGSQGIVLSYNDKGNAITEYYLLKDNDAFLLYKGIGISKVEDLDGNGDSELLVKENGKIYLFYAEDGKISKCDIEATIVSFGIGGDEIRVEMSKEKSEQLLLYKKIIHTNGTLRERKIGNIFFYNNKLFYYCLED